MKLSNSQLSLNIIETKKKKITWLSHTAIEMINRCPKCFWIKYNKKISQPQGIVSRLANRFDVVLKNYFDEYRNNKILPPIINERIKGRLQNPFQERYYHKINDNYGFYGKLDECIINEDGYIPVDFKTTSSDPRQKTIMEAYQHQIDEYVFLMNVNHKKTAGYGYLIFFFPDFDKEIHKGFPMITEIIKVKANWDHVEQRINRAITILQEPMPESAKDCEYCLWLNAVGDYY